MKFSKYNCISPYKDNFLLVNTLTGAAFFIDETVKKKIEGNRVYELSQKVLTEYQRTGVLVPDTADEYTYIKYITNRERFNNQVLSLTVLMTRNCNFRCVYCFEGQNKAKNNLSTQTKTGILNFVKKMFQENKNLKILSLTLFGGEPLLTFNMNYEWLTELKNYCTTIDKAFETMLITNGVLITDEIIQKLHSLNCVAVQITLDGLPEIHNKRRPFQNGSPSFDAVLGAIQKMATQTVLAKPIVRINIDKTNLSATYELLTILKEKTQAQCFIDFGIVKVDSHDHFAKSCFHDAELAEVLPPLWKKLDELGLKYGNAPRRIFNYCGLSKENFFTIDVRGDVYKCWEFVGEEKFVVAHLDEDGSMNNVSKHYYECLARDADTVSECKECTFLPVCGCGCASVSVQKSGSIFGKGCFKTKSIFLEQVHVQLAQIEDRIIVEELPC